jgi:ferrochelatase
MKRKGLIIINLGSPDSYSKKDVGTYLKEFLMDKRVIDVPWLIRQLIVKGFIIPFRVKNSAEAYKSIWTEKGSPLKVITEQFCEQVQYKVDIPAVVSMRYGNPNPETSFKKLEEKAGKLDEILLAPMYPHYAMSSYETAVEHVKKYVQSVRKDISVKVLKPFYKEEAYIASLAASIKPYLLEQDFDGYLFSYHGLPIRHLKKSDPTHSHCYGSEACCEVKSLAWETCYKHQVKETTRLVAAQLQLEESKVLLSFQSRLEGDKWLQPYTDVMLKELPGKGIKKLLVLCPAFVADCLETLEEINDRGKNLFIQAGGKHFVSVPCLNIHPQWVNTFALYCNGADNEYKHLWA